MHSEQNRRRRALIVLLVAALSLAAIFVGSVAFVVLRNLEIQKTSEQVSQAEFDAVRSRFKGQAPLVVMNTAGVPRVIHPDEALPRQPISKLNVRVWRPERSELVRLSIPSWVARLGGPKSYALDTLHLESMNLKYEDLERHGPGLIADFETRDRGRVLVWCE
jgi:hypothetical protein